MRKRILAMVLVIIMTITLMPVISAFAAGNDIAYINRYWDKTSKKVIEETKEQAATQITSSTSNLSNNEWYYVSGNIEISERISVQGVAYIILCDGAKLTARKGIAVPNGKELYIYGQNAGTGELVAEAEIYHAGIGSNSLDATGGTGTVTINGGIVTATGGNYGAGIGSGNKVSGGNVTINGGMVTANGGYYAAGIGGGSNGNGGNVTINGGTINATGSKNAAGIGGGFLGSGGDVTINGGMITATGGSDAAGIGGGGNMGNGGTVTIYGGMVTATGGGNAAGIGGGGSGNGGTVNIHGGMVTATGGNNAAGIGGGFLGSGGDVTINGGTINATGDNNAAGIGCGNGVSEHGYLSVYSEAKIMAGDSEPGTETTVDAYRSSRKPYVHIERSTDFTVSGTLPKTGDQANPTLLMMLLLASMGALLLVSSKAKKRNED